MPTELLSITRHEHHASPRYLTARDEPWVRALLALFDTFVGRTALERDRGLPSTVRSIAQEHGVSTRVCEGVARVVSSRFRAEVVSAIDPRAVRGVVFEEAARDDVLDRGAVLDRCARRLDSTPVDVERSLFADRPAARRLAAPRETLSPIEIIEAYNLALVQGLLVRTERVVVEVAEHVRAVVRFAKLNGLLCTCALGERGTRLEVSGPLSILRHTTKYGHALARFFPAVLSTTRFRLEASCVLWGEPVRLRIDATDRIARTHRLPRDADSAVERALARDFRRLRTDWSLEREADAIRVGERMFFPDFTLRRGAQRVLVEVVGYYTPEYLHSKLEALRAARDQRLIVCVDDTLACGDGDIEGRVLRFKHRVDARALVAAADELVGVSNPRSETEPVAADRCRD